MTFILHSVKIILNTSFEVRTRWFQLLCRHRRYMYATRENATPLYLLRPRNERAPHYRYICALSVYNYWYVRHPLRIYTETERDFLLRDLVLAMVCVKKNFRWFTVHFIETRTRHGHEVTARRSPSRLQTRSTRGHIELPFAAKKSGQVNT